MASDKIQLLYKVIETSQEPVFLVNSSTPRFYDTVTFFKNEAVFLVKRTDVVCRVPYVALSQNLGLLDLRTCVGLGYGD